MLLSAELNFAYWPGRANGWPHWLLELPAATILAMALVTSH